MATTADKKKYTCPRCDTKAEAARAPVGWHKDAKDELICGECFGANYRSLCISIPARGRFMPGIAQGSPESQRLTQELKAGILDAWSNGTRLANWAVTECLRHEPAQTTGQRLPALAVPLYAAFGACPLHNDWIGMATSANAVMRSAEKRYRALRLAVQGTHSATAPTFRFPFPYPVPRQNWTVRNEHEHLILSLPLGGQRMEIQLLNERESRVNRERLQAIVDGTAIGGELRLCGVGVGQDSRKGGMNLAMRRPGGGERKYVRVLVRISAYVPRSAKERQGLTMTVSTGAESLLYATVEGDTEPWTYHGDHIRRWVIGSRVMRQRWADDTKAEHRTPVRIRRRRVEAGNRHNEKYRRRLDSAPNEVAKNLLNYAQRRGVDTLIYDDSVRDFCPDFAYANLEDLLLQKAEAMGLTVLSSGEVASETPDPLDTETPEA